MDLISESNITFNYEKRKCNCNGRLVRLQTTELTLVSEYNYLGDFRDARALIWSTITSYLAVMTPHEVIIILKHYSFQNCCRAIS